MVIATRAVRLTVAMVLFKPDLAWLLRTVVSLCAAANHAREQGLLQKMEIVAVDNHGGLGATETEHAIGAECAALCPFAELKVLTGHGNIGYGAGNNLAIRSGDESDVILVLNPDVELHLNSIGEALAFLSREQACVMVTPVASGAEGEPLYLVKNYPRVFVLAVRGFAPDWLKRALQRRLDDYDRADRPYNSPITDAHIVSGCFMMMRRAAFERLRGFDERFFLYFEDFDLSLRMSELGAIVRLPTCTIVHAGGNTARKGWHHVGMFVRSAVRFFNRHGWRF